MTGFRFQDPLWLLGLLPVIVAGAWGMRRSREDAILYSSVELLRPLPVTWSLRTKRILPWLRIGGLGLMVVALARPQLGLEGYRIRSEGIAIQMCLDKSGSMRAFDSELNGQRANRLDAVKKVFRDFVTGAGSLPGRPDDLIGLVTFGGFAESAAPLTLDHGALLQVLETVQIPHPIKDARGQVINERLLQEEMATAIGDAVALSADRLRDTPTKSKIIILLSDGENTAGVVSPAEAAQAAKALGIRIYAIGVGSTGQAPFPAIDAFGREVLVPQHVRLDEETLRRLATETGGKYYNARNTSSLEQVYAEIDKLEKSLSAGQVYTEYRELFRNFLLSGLALVLVEVLLTSTRFRSLP